MIRKLVSVEDVLSQFRDKHVLYYPCPGNAGDSLIAVSTIQTFEKLDISFEIVDSSAAVYGEIVIIGGGGNLVPVYDGIASTMDNFLGRARQMVLLPQTIRGHERLLNKLDSSCFLFCRDAESYFHTLANTHGAHVYIEHDMVYRLDVEALAGHANATEFDRYFHGKMAEHGIDWHTALFRKNARYFRNDGESRGNRGHSDLDISNLFHLGTRPNEAFPASWAFLKAIRTVTAIETDRLHVGIVSGIVGTPCRLYDNTYGKNSAVHRHSIRHYHPCVEFVAE